MELDTLKEAWQRQTPTASLMEGGLDMAGLLAKLDRLEDTVRMRDVRETIAALFVMAFFTWRAVVAHEAIERAGAAIVVVGAAFIILWSRHKSSGRRAEAFGGDLPIVQFCRRELARVDAQMHLLRTVWLWYVAPTIIGLELMMLRRWDLPDARQIVAMSIVLAVGVAIAWLNIVAARHELLPLRDELAARIAELSR